MSRNKFLTIVGLLLFCVVVFLPPIVYGYVYPNVGDDTTAHLAVFDKMKAGDPISSQFILSYKLVGYPLIWISNLTGASIDSLFLWFNYVALALIGITIYFVVSQLVNRKAGWLSLIITLFGAQGILFQFYYGQIFNAINIGIILPLLLFSAVRYITQGRIYQLVLALLLSGLFGSFHTSGIYLPFAAGFTTVAFVAYKLIKRQHIRYRLVLLGVGMSVLPAVMFILFVPGAWLIGYYIGYNQGWGMAVPLGSYFMGIVSPTILVMLVFVAIFFGDIKKKMSDNARIVAILLGGVAIVLAVVSFAKLSFDPFRQALDLATVLALLIAILVSAFVWMPKKQMVSALLLLAVGFGIWHTLPPWFDYNSAIRSADKEAIAYVNSLDYTTYSSSPQVAFWIYDRFTKAKWAEGYAPLFIVRSLPMTPRSDPKNKWYDGHGIEPSSDYILLKTFNDGKVAVNVYKDVKR